jgi:AbiV family abortive infection protein
VSFTLGFFIGDKMSQVISEKVDTLSLLQVEQGISRSLETANELLDAAKLLNKNGYHLLSQAISILVIEENGKAVLLYRTILFEDDPNRWKQFWSDFLSHKPKIFAGM